MYCSVILICNIQILYLFYLENDKPVLQEVFEDHFRWCIFLQILEHDVQLSWPCCAVFFCCAVFAWCAVWFYCAVWLCCAVFAWFAVWFYCTVWLKLCCFCLMCCLVLLCCLTLLCCFCLICCLVLLYCLALLCCFLWFSDFFSCFQSIVILLLCPQLPKYTNKSFCFIIV